MGGGGGGGGGKGGERIGWLTVHGAETGIWLKKNVTYIQE